MKKIFGLISISIMSTSLLLTGCGGGGSSTVKPMSSTSFTPIPTITPPGTVTIEGMSREADYTAPAPAFLVTTVTDLGVRQTSSATLTADAGGNLVKITLNTPNSTVTWDTAAGDLIDFTDPEVGALANSAGTEIAILVGLDAWEFQSFGTWLTGFGTGSGRAGAISVGAPTVGSAIPGTGTATFTGAATGIYVDAIGNSHIAAGDLTVGADFSNRTLAFATSNTGKINLNTLDESLASNLDMTGTLTYSAGVNSFSGTVNATGLTGTADGRFYGPNAQELGGVFGLRASTGVESYLGGFGANQ